MKVEQGGAGSSGEPGDAQREARELDEARDLEAAREQRDAMERELRSAPAFVPAGRWQERNAREWELLEERGLSRFKRTVAQAWEDWRVSEPHPQLAYLRQQHPLYARAQALLVEIEGQVSVQPQPGTPAVQLTRAQRRGHAQLVALLWRQARALDRRRLAADVEEPEVGSPVRIRLRDGLGPRRRISRDLATSVVESNTLRGLLDGHQVSRRVRVAELGAGYGRLAHVHAATQLGTYFLFDAPASLALAQWYLSRVLPGRRLFHFRSFRAFDKIRSEVEAAEVAFFTPNQLQQIPDRYFDATVAIGTLPELEPAQAQLLIGELARTSGHALFLKQRRDAWARPEGGVPLPEAEAMFDSARWKVAFDRADPLDPRLFNRGWHRRR